MPVEFRIAGFKPEHWKPEDCLNRMAAYSMTKIETVYGTVFENILGEKISTKPVEIVSPFPWVKTAKGG